MMIGVDERLEQRCPLSGAAKCRFAYEKPTNKSFKRPALCDPFQGGWQCTQSFEGNNVDL